MAHDKLAQSDNPDTALLDAQLILEFVTDYSRTYQFAHPEKEIKSQQASTLESILQRRLAGEPIAYITGSREFWSIPLRVEPGVLIPRPDTEVLVEEVLKREPECPDGCIVDLGTGSGAIAIALSLELPYRQILAVEYNQVALAIAQKNILEFANSSVQLINGNWLNPFARQSVAIVVSNPPYLASDDKHLASLRYEPLDALVSADDGFEDYKTIIKSGWDALIPGGLLALEHGHLQAETITALLHQSGFENLSTHKDLARNDRVSVGYRTKSS